MSESRRPDSRPPQSQIPRTQTAGNLGEIMVPLSLVEVTLIIRVANEVEASNPHVAFLCRYYAYHKAKVLDPTSSGPNVRQFITALLQHLVAVTLERRNMSAGRLMQSFYKHYYKEYIQAFLNAADSSQLTKAYRTAAVLYEVVRFYNKGARFDDEILEAHATVEENSQIYYRDAMLVCERSESESESEDHYKYMSIRELYERTEPLS